jgi:triosephosphate isomerase
MSRKKIVAANWKMNLNQAQASKLSVQIKKNISKIKTKAEIILFPNSIYLAKAADEFKKSSKISIGAQNIYFENSGAFTGEISPEMIKSAGAKWVLCGHSERRIVFGETDEMVAKKVSAALENGLNVILCVGEDLDCRKKNQQNEKVLEQLSIALGGMNIKNLDKIVIAYEPVWAIGTGVTATSSQAQDMHFFIRKNIQQILGKKAKDISILYGGSCNPSNAEELFSCKDVDGGLIGGASLDADSFCKIVAAIS